eukprot:c21183_g1_i3.p1 GENE.c21183_g1_i3~~c21183_g1_i3.p1  ORF type:complete len:271 (+),score=127.46 c21183_g1_i3:416-1228(+)
MSKNLETVSEQISSATHRANLLEKGGDALSSELKLKEDELKVVKEQLTSLKTGELTLKRQVQVALATVEKLKADIKTRETQIDMIKQSEQVLDVDLKAKSEQIQLLTERSSLLERELNTKQETLNVVTQKLEAAEIELKLRGNQLGEENEKISNQLKLKEEMISNLEERLTSIEKVSKDLNGDNQTDSLLSKIHKLEKDQKEREEFLTHLFFQKSCELVRMLNTKEENGGMGNIESDSDLIEGLYSEVKSRNIPIVDWPWYIYGSLGVQK